MHESVLRSTGEFPCAADAEAVEFCREIVNEMVTAHGLTRDGAVAAVNRYWSEPWRRDRVPDTWIVGLALIYHETPETGPTGSLLCGGSEMVIFEQLPECLHGVEPPVVETVFVDAMPWLNA